MSSAFKVSAGSIIFANGLTGILVSILNCLQSHLNFYKHGHTHVGFDF